jgi:hypothetical protein
VRAISPSGEHFIVADHYRPLARSRTMGRCHSPCCFLW